MKRFISGAVFVVVFLFSASVAFGGSVKGRVSCEGVGVEGVWICDGVNFVQTDASGCYVLKTDRSQGVVWMSVPAGYTPAAKAANRLQPAFWAPLDKSTKKVDFELRRENQDSYTAFFITDCHLSDIDSKPELESWQEMTVPVLKKIAASATCPLYAFNLGDFGHELYWAQGNFYLPDATKFVADNDFPAPMYICSGNHDNDPTITDEDPNVDRNAERVFRSLFGPEWFSVNIGSDHWIMMDDIKYINTKGKGKKAPGVLGARDYDRAFTAEEWAWLEKDLSHVTAGSRVMLCTHCPMVRCYGSGELFPHEDIVRLQKMMEPYRTTFYCGHAHKMDSRMVGNIIQHTIPATSGDMWVTSDRHFVIGEDGTDGGILCCTYSPDKIESQYITYVEGAHKPMKAYDLNAVSAFYKSSPKVTKALEIQPDKHTDYRKDKWENAVLVNYWLLQPGQSVKMFQKTVEIPVECKPFEDPCRFVRALAGKIVKNPGKNKKNNMVHSNHMFCGYATNATDPVTIIVYDASGAPVWEETVIRPKSFDKNAR